MPVRIPVVLVLALSACNTVTYDDARSHAHATYERGEVKPEVGRRIYERIYDRFGGTRRPAFGLKGELANANRDIFIQAVRHMRPGALFDTSNHDFLFEITRELAPPRTYVHNTGGSAISVSRHYVIELGGMTGSPRRFIELNVGLHIRTTRPLASGGDIVLTASEMGLCLDASATWSSPPPCDQFVREATIRNLERLGRSRAP